ncbi:MAG: DUF1566 domain-containing protein [Verrucomicrobiota bacterium]
MKMTKWVFLALMTVCGMATNVWAQGSLTPPGPPAIMMKTLDEIPPTWSLTIPGSNRFALVLTNQAVLDKETGLVWERGPSTNTYRWIEAPFVAYNGLIGNRRGWRLPSIEELASLVDTTTGAPSLPSGHPFTNVQSWIYWSSTTYAENTSQALVVFFNSGAVSTANKVNCNYVWRVRGGYGFFNH